ncbi:F0F1 ATP synthase subunit epsilon [Candidatus Omnitrophota bacterium]
MLSLDVSVLSPKKVIFSGKAKSVSVPGEQGVLEVLPFHKHILSRLVSGALLIDERKLNIQRGIIKVEHNRVTIIVEE